MRGVKIVATLGPATTDRTTLGHLLAAGVDVVRLNAAHGTAASHRDAAGTARAAADSAGRSIGVLVDLPGPKLRTGAVEGDLVRLETGHPFTLANATSGDPIGNATRVTTTVPQLSRWVTVGDEVFLADGGIVLCVTRVTGADVETEIVRGGMLRSHKGMHVPSAELLVESFSAVDAAALALARRLKADFVGVSFVRTADDLDAVRARLPRRGARPALVAKIETAAALEHLDAIVDASDALMVARGDLGIQVPARRVPFLQKEIIRAANRAGKPVITATQMLESMTRSPLPTRAEVSDIANAVIDGTDALMLSEETAVGDFPVEAVRTMAEVAETAEAWPRAAVLPVAGGDELDRVGWAVAHAAVLAAEDLRVAAILCPTRTGTTARRVAAFRPSMPIVGLSPDPTVLRQLCLLRSVHPRMLEPCADTEAQTRLAVRTARGRRSSRGATSSQSCRARPAAAAATPTPCESFAPNGKRTGPPVNDGLQARFSVQVVGEGDGDHLAAVGADVATGDLLDHGDRVRPFLHESRVDEVPGEHAEHAVAELLVVEEDLLVGIVEPEREVLVDVAQPRGHRVVAAEREPFVHELGFLVRVQVVRRVEERDDAREPVRLEPDQLFLAAHLAVIAREPARAFGRGQAILDDPTEEPGLQALRPTAAQRHAATPGAVARAITSRSRAIRADAATSCTRTIRAACVNDHTVVASVASSRCDGSESPVSLPRNVLRDAPTTTGTPSAATMSASRARSSRLCAAVLPNPMPGSASSASEPTPAARAASSRVDKNSTTSRTTSS